MNKGSFTGDQYSKVAEQMKVSTASDKCFTRKPTTKNEEENR
jgi:hypothetical protein